MAIFFMGVIHFFMPDIDIESKYWKKVETNRELAYLVKFAIYSQRFTEEKVNRGKDLRSEELDRLPKDWGF